MITSYFSITAGVAEDISVKFVNTTLGSIFVWLTEVVLSTLYYLLSLSIRFLQETSTMEIGSSLEKAWSNSLYLVNILAIVFLLVIALANALRINFDAYAVKKTLPNLIAGIIVANLSLLIMRAIFDLINVIIFGIAAGGQEGVTTGGAHLATSLLNFILGVKLDPGAGTIDMGEKQSAEIFLKFITRFLAGGGASFAVTGATIAAIGATAGTLLIGALVFCMIWMLIPTIIITILALLMLARYFILVLCVSIAPIAIMFYFFPPTKSMGQKWLDEFSKWAFMPVIVFFFLRVATYLESTPTDDKPFLSWMQYIGGIAIMFAAMYVPFQVGGLGAMAMNYWANTLQGKTGLTKGLGDRIKSRGQEMMYKNRYLSPFLTAPAAQRNLDQARLKKSQEKAEQEILLKLFTTATDKDEILAIQSRLRVMSADAQKAFEDKATPDIENRLENGDLKGAFEKYKNKDFANMKAHEYNDVVGALKVLQYRSVNPTLDENGSAKKFMQQHMAGTNLDLGAGSPPIKQSNNNFDTNSNLLSKYFTQESIAKFGKGEIPKEQLQLLGGSKFNNPNAALQAMNKDISRYYEKSDSAKNVNTPSSSDNILNEYQKQYKEAVSDKATKTAAAYRNVGSETLGKIVSSLNANDKENAGKIAKNAGLNDVAEKIKNMSTDQNGKISRNLDFSLLTESLGEHQSALKFVNSDANRNVSLDTLNARIQADDDMKNNKAAHQIVSSLKKEQTYFKTQYNSATDPKFDKLVAQINTQGRTTTEGKIQTVIEQYNAGQLDDQFISDFFGDRKIVNTIQSSKTANYIDYDQEIETAKKAMAEKETELKDTHKGKSQNEIDTILKHSLETYERKIADLNNQKTNNASSYNESKRKIANLSANITQNSKLQDFMAQRAAILTNPTT